MRAVDRVQPRRPGQQEVVQEPEPGHGAGGGQDGRAGAGGLAGGRA